MPPAYAAARAGLSKYDGKTGQLVMTVDLEPGSADPHGLVFYNGKLISCDAGNHPGWRESESPIAAGFSASIWCEHHLSWPASARAIQTASTGVCCPGWPT